MLKVLKLNKEKELKEVELGTIVEQLDEIEERSVSLATSIDEAKTKSDIELLDETIKELEEQKTELEERKYKFETDIQNIEEEINETKERSEKMETKKTTELKDDVQEIRQGINRYVKSRGSERAFEVVDAGALVPEEVLQTVVVKSDAPDLKGMVRIVKVNSGSGKFPVITHTNNRLNTVLELEQNPELLNPTITDIKYTVDTYRGYIPLSQEVIDDADYDVVGLIADEIVGQEFNTTNYAIAQELKKATPKTVATLDDLKNILNVDLKRRYAGSIIMSASFYNEVDKLKDLEGRYLLQDDITAPSGKSLFGKPVEVLDDTLIGTNEGDMVAFIGDPSAYCAFFDRVQTTVKWIDHNVYGQLLAVFSRFGVGVLDTEAGFYVTYDPTPGV